VAAVAAAGAKTETRKRQLEMELRRLLAVAAERYGPERAVTQQHQQNLA
jgi:hypothetical protein